LPAKRRRLNFVIETRGRTISHDGQMNGEMYYDKT